MIAKNSQKRYMKRLRNWWTKIQRWWLSQEDDDDDDTNDDRLIGFKNDLYEDLREDILDDIIENRRKLDKYAKVSNKIQLGLKLTDKEQRESGIIQFDLGDLE